MTLNFASRPFRNEALPALLFGVGVVLLVATTLDHALVLRRLLYGSTPALQREVAALDAEEVRLRNRISDLRPQRTDPKTVAQWAFVKDLVDRRVFSWTELFARLEELQPPGVRLLSIEPSVKRGEVRVQVSALVKSEGEGLSFVKALEESTEFADVYPLDLSKKNDHGGGEAGIEYRYVMRYTPQPRKAGAVKAKAPAGEPADTEEAPADESEPTEESVEEQP